MIIEDNFHVDSWIFTYFHVVNHMIKHKIVSIEPKRDRKVKEKKRKIYTNILSSLELEIKFKVARIESADPRIRGRSKSSTPISFLRFSRCTAAIGHSRMICDMVSGAALHPRHTSDALGLHVFLKERVKF